MWHDWPLLQIVGSDIDDSTMNASSWVHHSQILCLPSSRGVQAIDSSVLHHQAQAHADPDVAAGACRPQQGLLQPAGGAATTGLGQDDVGSEDTARACIDSGLPGCTTSSRLSRSSHDRRSIRELKCCRLPYCSKHTTKTSCTTTCQNGHFGRALSVRSSDDSASY